MIRALGLVGLLLALVIVGLLVKKQLGGTASPARPASSSADSAVVAPAPASDPRQVQEQFKQSLDAAMQPRALPDEAK
jgi:hypothetical protein